MKTIERLRSSPKAIFVEKVFSAQDKTFSFNNVVVYLGLSKGTYIEYSSSLSHLGST